MLLDHARQRLTMPGRIQRSLVAGAVSAQQIGRMPVLVRPELEDDRAPRMAGRGGRKGKFI
jgi:hypothetical protein